MPHNTRRVVAAAAAERGADGRDSSKRSGNPNISAPKKRAKTDKPTKSSKGKGPKNNKQTELVPGPDSSGRIAALEKQVSDIKKHLDKKDTETKQCSDLLLQMKQSMDNISKQLQGGPSNSVELSTEVSGTPDMGHSPAANIVVDEDIQGNADPLSCHNAIANLSSHSRVRVSNFMSSSVSIYDHVTQKNREKVWSGEFIDLSLLSPSHHYSSPNEEFNIAWRSGDDGDTPAFSLVQKSKSKIKSFAQWESLFDIYHAIYVAKSALQSQASALVSYKNNVRMLHSKNADYLAYDETFRTLRLQKGWAWDHKPGDLMWSAAFPTLPKGRPDQDSQPFLPKGNKANNPSKRGRYCFKFNDPQGSRCTAGDCLYPHVCSVCSKPHPRSKCRSAARARGSFGSSQPGAAPPSKGRV